MGSSGCERIRRPWFPADWDRYACSYCEHPTRIPAVRLLQGVDPYVGGEFAVSTTTYVHPTHYTSDDATVIASGFEADGSGLTLTAVTSNSAFISNHGVVSQFELNPAH